MRRIIYISLTFIAVACIIALHRPGGPDLPIDNMHPDYIRKQQKLGYDQPNGFYEYFNRITTPIGSSKSNYPLNYQIQEYQKSLSAVNKAKSTQNFDDYTWKSRGPYNVGGRTRCIIIDPDDTTNSTWFAGSASGGVWYTNDKGQSWDSKSNGLRNLATTTLCMANTNHNIIYAGTGEGFGGFGMVSGGGIYVTNDKGENWQIIDSTYNKEIFRYVNDLWVAPNDDQIILAATNEGVFKTFDGGNTWDTVGYYGYMVQDFAVNSKDSNIIYAGVNSLGIVKTIDGGDNWYDSYNGIGVGKRFEVEVSPVDTSYVFTTVEVNSAQMDIYISKNSGQNWLLHNDVTGGFVNFHGVQGWFNNILAPHPTDKNQLFVGGVYLGKVDFKTHEQKSPLKVTRVDTFGTGSYMSFYPFGSTYLGGGMITGLDNEAEVELDDFVSVDIYFGDTNIQKAHRFTVPPGEGAGVPEDYYTFEDYVEVPFTAWNSETGEQLMVSFRDNERDGKFNLVKTAFDDNVNGREYLFIHAEKYDTEADSNISKNGGFQHMQLYFFWPILHEDLDSMPSTIPTGKISVEFGQQDMLEIRTSVLSNRTKNTNLHVDHHDMKTYFTNDGYDLVVANDGGVAISHDEGESWDQLTNGYITTQFYGIAKHPDRHEYIGGMQDNGTWQSPIGETADSNSNYTDRIEGDGFEALWHPDKPGWILGSSYNNLIKVSLDGGENWDFTVDGFNGDGPFITRLSHSKKAPNLVYAIGSRGVYRHPNFGYGFYNWQLTEMGPGWTFENSSFTSHLVEASDANPEIVWAGQAMNDEPRLNFFVSTDYGATFDTVLGKYEYDLGFASGLATHPTQDSTAYVLFSMHNKPKILRTKDLGQEWEDISGFGNDSVSSNGFPDVMVHSFMVTVLPDSSEIMWAGTEIGIFESKDDGLSWNIITADHLPNVSIWQMDLTDEGDVIVATHGRGIWSAGNVAPNKKIKIDPTPPVQPKVEIYPNPANNFIQIKTDYTAGTLQIISLNGNVFYQEYLTDIPEIFELNISAYPSGSYIVRLTDGQNNSVVKLHKL